MSLYHFLQFENLYQRMKRSTECPISLVKRQAGCVTLDKACTTFSVLQEISEVLSKRSKDILSTVCQQACLCDRWQNFWDSLCYTLRHLIILTFLYVERSTRWTHGRLNRHPNPKCLRAFGTELQKLL